MMSDFATNMAKCRVGGRRIFPNQIEKDVSDRRRHGKRREGDEDEDNEGQRSIHCQQFTH